MDRILKNNLLRRKIVAVALCVMLTGGMTSCLKPPDKIDLGELRGTQWKLSYIVDTYDGQYKRIILEPQDCDWCYTLTFDSEKKWYASGISTLNTVSIEFLHLERPEMKILVTDLDETNDGNYYTSLIRSVSGITWIASDSESSLILFVYNDPDRIFSTHTLHFERITP